MAFQYASEAEYMAIMRLKEQQRQNIKAHLERERSEQYKRMNQLQVITERSHEDSSCHESLLIQSIQPDENKSLVSSIARSEKSQRLIDRHLSRKSRKRNKSGNRGLRKLPKEGGPTNSLTSVSCSSASMSFDRDQLQTNLFPSTEAANNAQPHPEQYQQQQQPAEYQQTIIDNVALSRPEGSDISQLSHQNSSSLEETYS